ncbi:MAG: PaaI family thioesterase [Rhizobium sp.]|nr:PaaI family thioesterase [Rhizobium sp.]
MTPVLTVEEIEDFLAREFPQINAGGRVFTCVSVAPGTATLRLHPDESHLRPGGTVSGPALFALADVAAYVALLAHIGPVPLALTTQLNINFLNRADPVPLDGVCRILKLGRSLAMLEVSVERADTRQLIAHATTTYSIPPAKNDAVK